MNFEAPFYDTYFVTMNAGSDINSTNQYPITFTVNTYNTYAALGVSNYGSSVLDLLYPNGSPIPAGTNVSFDVW
jgi:hypothetical protein